MIDLPDYDSPQALKGLLDSRGMAMQKKFGQNFMINGASRARLVASLGLEKDMPVWEIGPGLGAMTSEILDTGAKLTAFEIDRGFSSILRELFGSRPNFSLVEGDVLKTWQALARDGAPSRLFGNLPYNIAATIIGDTITAGVRFDSIVITVQKEVALRMAAKPDTEDYSSFSALCQWAYDVTPVMDLSPGSFWPRPNVTSRAVKMTKKAEWPRCADPRAFTEIIRALFSSRRKTVKNNLSAWLARKGVADSDADRKAVELLSSAGINPQARAETIDVETFLALSDIVRNI